MAEYGTSSRRTWARIWIAAAAIALPVDLMALQPEDQAPGRSRGGPAMGYSAPELEVGPSLTTYKAGAREMAQRVELQGLFQQYSNNWEVRWDERGDRAHLIQGVGIPLLPGKGNKLTRSQLGLSAFRELSLNDVEPLLRDFMDRNLELFRVDLDDLVLDAESSVVAGENQNYWSVEFQQTRNGIPVDGANIYFRINNGNIVQFGNNRIGDVRVNTVPRITRAQAFRTALRTVGFRPSEVSERVERGTLKIMPILRQDDVVGEPYLGRPGDGYRYRLAWQFVFRRNHDARTYRAIIDARNGQMLQFVDLNAYADALVQGGIYPVTNTDPEVKRPFTFATVTNGTTKNTNGLGIYDYTGGTATATLNGQFFQMSDACGAISLSNSTNGALDFGTSGGTDCTTPGIGGAGNTHSSRSGFYHLTNINRKAISFLPGNSWLQGKVTANMNINNTCNAFWNGSTLNFYRSGGGCANTGELAAVFLHEWGHGMDTNSGGAASEQGTGEAVGDIFATLETRDGCIGQNFLPGQNCDNCTNCTGVRDISDFDLSGPAVIAKPSTVTDNGGINCDAFACPYLSQGIFPYQGPMGYEGHCESYIASSAVWDLITMLTAQFGTDPGWAAMDAIWYKSLTPSKSAYQLVSGGKCNAAATVNGCAASNWYTVFLPADDDDGNLANGTPNGCRIWDAFNAHGIACGTRPACSVGGGPTPTPVSTATRTATATQTRTPTRTNTPVNTNTPAPPTATFTPAPPTATFTPAPPTNTFTPTRTFTPAPPTNTFTPAPPTNTPGAGQCLAVGVGIPDNNTTGVTSTMFSQASGPLTDLNVSVKINHTWVGDLFVQLRHVDTNKSTAIIDRPGVPAISFGCSGDNVDVTLDDSAANPVENACAASVPAISGTLRPNNALTTFFNGDDAGGLWEMKVIDSAGSDVGTFVNWCLIPTTGGSPPTPTRTSTPVGPTATRTSTPVGPTSTPTPVSSGELIVNGGFEGSVTPWVAQAVGVYPQSNTGNQHTGTGYVTMGFANNVNGSTSGVMYQQVAIPSNATGTLSLWLNITSSEVATTAFDFLDVELRSTSGALLSTLATYSNVNQVGGVGPAFYSQKTFNVAAFKGQTVRVQLRARTDGSLSTWFRVDDVSLR